MNYAILNKIEIIGRDEKEEINKMKVFVFDVDDTLYDQIDPFKESINSYFSAQMLAHSVPVVELYVAFRYYSDLVFDQVEAGKLSLEKMRVYRITEAFRSFGVTIKEEEARAFQKRYQENQGNITLRQDMFETLSWLIEHDIPVAILTNGPKTHQLKKITQLGLEQFVPKERIFISGAIGLAKPNPEVFHYIEHQLAIPNGDYYYIGDSFENDVIGATGAQWHSIWLNKRHMKRPKGMVIPDVEVTTDSILRVVIDIVEQDK